MVSCCPVNGVILLPSGLSMACKYVGVTSHLLAGMILQVIMEMETLVLGEPACLTSMIVE